MNDSSSTVVVTGDFDNPRTEHLRLLEAAAHWGNLIVLLTTDETICSQTGVPPRFSLAERTYFLEAVRYVGRVIPVSGPGHGRELPATLDFRPDIWVDVESPGNELRQKYCDQHGLEYRVLTAARINSLNLAEQPDRILPLKNGSRQTHRIPEPNLPAARKKVVVTGCYDWFHTGHIRFFEEASAHGDLYVILGHDANIRLLKGEGHPLFPQEERRYMVASIKYVTEALISSGEGWLDADPEIRRIKPDIYAVNEDGDRGGKREYCARMGLEYLVLRRTPAPGLPRRSSTDLRGF